MDKLKPSCPGCGADAMNGMYSCESFHYEDGFLRESQQCLRVQRDRFRQRAEIAEADNATLRREKAIAERALDISCNQNSSDDFPHTCDLCPLICSRDHGQGCYESLCYALAEAEQEAGG